MQTISATLALILCGIAPALGQTSPSQTSPSQTSPAAPTKQIISLPGPSDLKWMTAPPALPKGAQMAVLAGDPGQSGRFVIRLKMSADYEIPAYHHPTQEIVTILSGSFHAGMGNKLNRKASQGYDPGGFFIIPAQMQHFAWAASPTVIQIESEGPFVIDYVNPADDPRKSPATQEK